MDMICFSSALDTTHADFASQISWNKPTFAKTPTFARTRWIQSDICIHLISFSHLLNEALFQLLEQKFQPHCVESNRHWVLLDAAIGQDRLKQTIRDWKQQQPKSYFIVLELPNEPDRIFDCIEAGAHGYVLQGATGEQILETLQQVDQRRFHCSPEITLKLFERLAQAKAEAVPPEISPVIVPVVITPVVSPVAIESTPVFTQREQEVLGYLAQSYSDRAIAEALFISVRTVKHHVHNLLRKLEVQSRWQAAQWAIDRQPHRPVC